MTFNFSATPPAGLSQREWAEVQLEAAAISTDALYNGIEVYQFRSEWKDPELRIAGKDGKHGPSVKCPDIYEALRRKGKSKKNAAQISNECYTSPQCKCH